VHVVLGGEIARKEEAGYGVPERGVFVVYRDGDRQDTPDGGFDVMAVHGAEREIAGRVHVEHDGVMRRVTEPLGMEPDAGQQDLLERLHAFGVIRAYAIFAGRRERLEDQVVAPGVYDGDGVEQVADGVGTVVVVTRVGRVERADHIGRHLHGLPAPLQRLRGGFRVGIVFVE
jgi:hypothetical protein